MALDETYPPPLERIEAIVLRAAIASPVTTSFGTMRDRPAVLIRAVDAEGAEGWGEVWCNFPVCGAEHRAALVATTISPWLLGRSWPQPEEAFAFLQARARILALQTGEFGPLQQAIAGIDIALWDLAARRAGRPVGELLGGHPLPSAVPAYASGIHPNEMRERLAAARSAGLRRFKLKVGFGRAQDEAAVAAFASDLAPGEAFMLDANQAWDVPTAREMALVLADFGPGWLEEPMAVDEAPEAWASLKAASRIPLAGGENLASRQAFDEHLAARRTAILQPDIAKWGGFSGCFAVARAAIGCGVQYCPHFLGSAIGLLASAQLLGAVGGDGLLEVDVNPNPLRDHLVGPLLVQEGGLLLPSGPGLGAVPDPAVIAAYEISRSSASTEGLLPAGAS